MHNRLAAVVTILLAMAGGAPAAPVVRSEVAFLLEKDLIPENIAWDAKSGAFFVGSMYKAKIIRIGADGTVSDFVPSRRDGLLSVLGMKIDGARRELWAAAGNFVDRPPMEVADPASHGRGAIFRFDLETGALIRRYDAPGASAENPLWFNDLVLTPGGDVFATAGGRGIWRLRRGSETIEPFLAPPDAFFNGIAITPDGKTLFAAAHATGVMKIDVDTKAASLLSVPSGSSLLGIDGLYFHEKSLVGIQNGTGTQRVVRAWLDDELNAVTRLEILERDHPLWDIPLTGTIVGDDLYYVGRSQLRAFENGKIWPSERLQQSVILKLPLASAHDALLEMHRREIRAHFERDTKWLDETTAEVLVTANSGKIERLPRESVRRFFEGYFRGATYLQYEDVEPPVVRVSDDGSMGWILSRTRVRRTQDDKERSFVYAGIMTYEKRGDGWVRVANVSTFE